MVENPWFPMDDAFDESAYSADDLDVVLALRERTLSWSVPWTDSNVQRSEDGTSTLVYVTLADFPRKQSLGRFGFHLTDGNVVGDQLETDLALIPENPTGLSFTAQGTAQERAITCADWFESLLARPVVLDEWDFRDRTYATFYRFADTGEGLAVSYNVPAAPPGQPIEHIIVRHGEAGSFTFEVVNPSRTIKVRGL